MENDEEETIVKVDASEMQEIQGGFALRKNTLNKSAFQTVVLAAVL